MLGSVFRTVSHIITFALSPAFRRSWLREILFDPFDPSPAYILLSDGIGRRVPRYGISDELDGYFVIS